MRKITFLSLLIVFAVISPVFAQNDPVGANTAQALYAPVLAGGGGFTTSQGGAPASALNPAAGGDAQRIVFDFGFMGLPGFGDEEGFGMAANLGALFPTRFGVFGGSFWFLDSPFDSFPVGTVFQANLNAAKELFPGMSVGAGLNFGYNTENNVTVSGDLGFRYNIGNLGPLGNFTWAVALRSMGRSWVPHMFTPAGGVAFDFVHFRGVDGGPDPLRMSLAADLMVPTGPAWPNLAGKLGLSFHIAELITISGSSQFNIRESLDPVRNPPSPIPSIGIGANWRLGAGGERTVTGMPTGGELAVNLAGKPLYGGVWATGAGVTWTVGVADRNPPRIVLYYPEAVWFAPNNTGRADYLEFPISITDERFVESWIFEISDEEGNVIRTYRNTEIRPQTQGVRNIIDRLLAVQTGVDVPPTLRWDGTLETGGIAPDGRYFFTITAADDSGNVGTVGPFEVFVRVTPPEINLTPFEGDLNIFAPGEGGGRDTITITQTGSREDLWESGIYDILGNRVRTFNFVDQEPRTIVWDGRDDRGNFVPDGVYNYRISATDRALNTSGASLENIIVSTVRPIVSLTIEDAFFSPNRDGIKDTMNFNLTVPLIEEVSNWELQIRDLRGIVQRTFSGGAAVPPRLEFDGIDAAGNLLPEGIYSAILSVRYRNGYVSLALSPSFTLRVTPPWAQIQIEDPDQALGLLPVFSPNNTGYKDELILIMEGSNELLWVGEVRRRGELTGPPVRTFRFSGTPPRRHVWDGVTNAGAIAPDGFYTFQLISTDQAGNTGRSNIVEFELDTRDTPVFVSTDLRAFSPTGTGFRDTINIIPQIQERDGISSWRVDILNVGEGGDGGAVSVRSFEGGSYVPAQITWDGRTSAGPLAPDGTFVARLDIEYRAGSRPSALSLAFGLRTVPPQGRASVPFNIFAPNGNENRDTLPINVITEGNDEWDAVIFDNRNNPVRSWSWRGRAPNLIWDGRDEAGNIVPDGFYSFSLSSTDEAGNSTRININNIEVDARIPSVFLTASALAIAPRPQQAEAMRFNIVANITSGIDMWRMELRDENNVLVRSFPAGGSGSGTLPSVIPWDGRDSQGVIREGRFTASLVVNYTKGDIVNVSAPAVLVDISGPILGLFYEPEFFSPDNDGVNDELFIFLSARDASPIAHWSLEIRETEGTRQLFRSWGGRGSPAERIIWDGRSNWGELVQSAMDYHYTFTATDALGNSSTITGIITTDVLVIRDGDILRIQIPSITFRANHADFIGIPQDRLQTNMWALGRVAEILNRFRDYRITVEGHANPVLGTAREENEVLMPLSLARAQFVIDHLAGAGVSRARLSPVGRGGTINVADPRDQDNSWKNRRVEFLLIR